MATSAKPKTFSLKGEHLGMLTALANGYTWDGSGPFATPSPEARNAAVKTLRELRAEGLVTYGGDEKRDPGPHEVELTPEGRAAQAVG